MDVSALRDPVFVAKVVDFVIFVIALVFLWTRVISGQLERQQEAQNKQVEDAQGALAAAEEAVVLAQAALETAKADATRMVDFGLAQAERIVADERADAEAHAGRIADHANGERERERYRVRRELLEETVEKAHAQARAIVATELDAARQGSLVERLLTELERAHA